MQKKNTILLLINMTAFLTIEAQTKDTTTTLNLDEITISEETSIGGIEHNSGIKGNVIYAGKKNEVILLDKINADLSTNNTRQVFAKVPGITVWENDGSGIQASISARGLSPNRSWEFNVRQNGYDISSEIFGYPESYYTPPMEALEKIEVIRGAASLQYGPQFGGLLNYKIKKGNSNKIISFETQQTMGSYGLFNTYNAIGGTYKKFSYYAFLHHREAEGWRENSRYNIYTGYVSLNYQLTKKIKIEGEYTNMNYKSQQPGGLTDMQYETNHQQSSRKRNWFGAPYNIISLNINYAVTEKINLQLKSFATIAQRNSVGYTKAINLKDSINPTTLEYSARQIDRDQYENYGTEARLSVKYNFLGQESALAAGFRAYSGDTKRNQLGIGTTGDDFDLTLTNSQYGRSLNFRTINYAAFVENIFQLGKRIKIIPGLRFDYIENLSRGYINNTQAGVLTENKKRRHILLYGMGLECKVSEKTNVYANYSLAYRPVTFSELTPSATNEIIDENLKDANGFNIDLGYRGSVKKIINFDIGVFYLHYNNRIGSIIQNGSPFKTNIGTSVSKGLESYIEINVVRMFTENSKLGTINIFTSNSLIDARYVNWNNPAIANDPTKSIESKRVENAPQYTHRFGITYQIKGLLATCQMSNVGDIYTDAANTELPNATGTIGKLSGYQVLDASLSYKFMGKYNVKMGINNITDEKYATRRATGYPGPGILPGNGRTYFISIGGTF